MSDTTTSIKCSGSPSCACPSCYPAGWREESIEPPSFSVGRSTAVGELSFGPRAEVRATNDHTGLTVSVFDAEGGEVLSAVVRFGPGLEAVIEHLALEQTAPWRQS